LILYSFVFAFLPPPAVSPDAEFVTVDEGRIRGEIVGLEGAQLRVRTSEGERFLRCADILSVVFSREEEPLGAPHSMIELVNGDRLLGRPVAGEADLLTFRLQSRQALDLSVSALRRWVRIAGSEGRSPEDYAGNPEADRVYRIAEGGLDHLDGTFLAFEEGGFRFESPLGESRFSFEEAVALVLLLAEPPPESKELLALVDLVDGTRLTGRLESFEGGAFQVSLAAGPRVLLPVRDLASMGFRNGRTVVLSDLEAASIEEVPFFGGPDALRFSVGRDRSVGGGPLRCAGREFARGLGLHARTRLRFALAGAYRAFRASVGIDDEVLRFPRSGSAIFRVILDGKTAFESAPLRAGSEPVRIPEIDVSGVDDLVLEADFGDGDPVGDRVDLLDPILVRP
jgi:hypothetical protein